MIDRDTGGLQIVDLRTRPALLETVAGWHQQAWQQDDVSERQARLRDHLREGTLPTTLLAIQDEDAVGSASLVHYQRLGGFDASVWLANVFVKAEYRCRGIGSRLVEASSDFASRLKLPRLYLYTHDQQKYYSGLGWQTVKQHQFGGRPITIMRLELG